ncbi:S46 family peptidase [Thermophagus sp. OGC60D27]|uniref:S46 family peptidase n=1 Tax=Thermophagus sp. OGC60D27 TaxID=3458415 RepID=UPI0040381FBF
MWQRAIFLIIFHIFIVNSIHADEGMWMPWYLPQSQIDKMYDMGLEVPIDEIFGENESSLNRAIVSLDEGSCTGSFISSQGLLLTNHHCAYSDIQKHSNIDNDLLKKGYWAHSLETELPNPGKTATILVDAKNLTPLFNKALENASSRIETQNIIDSISRIILDTVSVGNGQQAEIKDFLYQNMFFLLTTQTFRDVRLVGAPPEEIAQFGGEYDNWMWPRHSADFAIYRIYCSPEGLPADYDPNNVPFHPNRILEISTLGVEEGDFTMTLGYPGETQRYITAAGLKETYSIINPVIAEVGKIKQSVWQKNMKKSPVLGIQYADKYANSANFQKYATGQNESIEKLKLIDKREKLENHLREQFSHYGEFQNALKASNILYLMRQNLTKTTIVTIESLINGPDISSLILETFNLFNLLQEDPVPENQLTQEVARLQEFSQDFFENFSFSTDKEVFEAMLKYYLSHLEDSFRVENDILLKHSDDISKEVEIIYSKSLFTDKNKFDAFLLAPSAKQLLSDPGFDLYYGLIQKFGPIYAMFNKMDEQLEYTMHLLLKSLSATDTIGKIYPDANSTLRLSFGKIKPYSPKDGITYASFSFIGGMIEKINSGKSPYRIQTDVLSLSKNEKIEKSDNNKTFPLCFISDNDITGGNSGSPVLNSRGQIVGLAFDGNWEGMGSDISYSPDLQRCISVDIRYILFLIEKLSDNHQLMNELNLINPASKNNLSLAS